MARAERIRPASTANGRPASTSVAAAMYGGAAGVERQLRAALAHLNADRLEDAEALLAEVRRCEPRNADAVHMLGIIDYRRERHEPAAKHIKKAIRLNPDKAEYYVNYASVARARGLLPEARRYLRKAIELEPDMARAYGNLGNVLVDMQRLDDAVAQYRKAIELQPGAAIFWHNLAYSLAASSRLEEAFAVIQEAEEGGVDCRHAYARIGEERINSGADAEAVMVFAEMLQAYEDDEAALLGMACALTREGRLQDALPFAERGVELYEQNAELQGTMGYLLAMADRFPDALPYLQRKVELRPDDAHARANLAVALKRLDRSEEAREMGESALELEPAQPTAHAIMAALCRERGDFERALGHFEKALERKPDNGSVLFGLYGIKKDVSEEDDVAAILATLAAKETITAEELVQYNFTLANIFDRLKSPERAIFYYKAANDLRAYELRLKGQKYGPKQHESFAARCEEVFTPELFEQLRPYGHPSERPIFIIGMPRSGTTLTEQIISSHPEVFGAGELTAIKEIVQARDAGGDGARSRPFPVWVPELDGEAIRAMAERYLEAIGALAGEELRVTDKMPHNFHLAGLIAVLFPNARVVHCMRDPVDTCLSCFRQNFDSPHPYSNNLAHLGHHYRQYERLMAHWRNVLPIPMYEARYEELVADQERISREMIDFCGLEWDDACLQFHRAERSVKTASLWQVRQPIYKQSIQRWKPYEPYIGELLEALDDRQAAE